MIIPANFTNVTAASTGFDYPLAWYIFEVKSSSIETNADGINRRVDVKAAIEMGPGPSTQYAGGPITHRMSCSEKALPFMKRFFLHCGIDEAAVVGNTVDADWLVGRRFLGKIGKNDKGYLNITATAPLSDWDALSKIGAGNGTAQATTPAAPPQTAAQPALMAPSPMAPAQQAPQPMQQVAQPGMMPAAVPAPQPGVAPQPQPGAFPAPAPAAGKVG